MKVAYLFGSLNRGGTETLMLDVCQSLRNEDFAAIGVYRKSGVLEEAFHLSKVPFTKISVGKNPIRYLFNLRKFIKQNHVDILHAHQPIDALLGQLASLGLKKKLVLSFHGFDFEQESLLIKYIVKRTNKNVFVSNYQQNYFINKYRLDQKKQRIIHNGISLQKFEEKDSIPECLKDVGIDTIKMAMVGNFVVGREHLTVCKFLKLLNERNINYSFYFIGKKDENKPHFYDDCYHYCEENRLLNNVHFLGLRKDVPAFLKYIDAFIFSTEHDTFGIAVIEAMAVGLPVFVNDWGVMKEITENGKLATLYKTKDEFDLLEKFTLFLQDKASYKIKAQEAMQIVRQKYSIQNHIHNLKTLYTQLLTKNE